jgi:NAD(P)-dependent dehydrogenase (short-subunit alcohol dehydrogenase family)
LNNDEKPVVLVTGAGRGLGRGLALGFSASGYRVAIDDLTPVNLDETQAEILRSGGETRPYLFDVAKKMPAQALVESVLEDWGRIDVLVNNAGVHPRASLYLMDEWDWQRVMEVNLHGPFFLMQAVGRVMRDQGWGGVMINVASPEALDVIRQAGPDLAAKPPVYQPDSAAYLASKAGLIALGQAAALEFAPDRIRVNTLCPLTADPEDVYRVVNQALVLASAWGEDISGRVFAWPRD